MAQEYIEPNFVESDPMTWCGGVPEVTEERHRRLEEAGIQTYRLNEPITPFSHSSNAREINDTFAGDRPGYEAVIALDPGNLLGAQYDRLLLHVFLTRGYAATEQLLAPLNPGLGYEIDERDYDLQTRLQKMLPMLHTIQTPREEEIPYTPPIPFTPGIDFTHYPLYGLRITTVPEELREAYLTEPPSPPYRYTERFKPHLIQRLQMLRVSLDVGADELLEAAADPSYIRSEVRFSEFYPKRRGPLAPIDYMKARSYRREAPIRPEQGLGVVIPHTAREQVSLRFTVGIPGRRG